MMSPPDPRPQPIEHANPRQQHVIAIDLVRFVAAVLVLFSHLAFSIAERPDSKPAELSGHTMPASILPGLSFYGWIGVQVFFVISGIVIAYSARGATPYAFLRSRVVRLVPAAWVCSTLTLAVLAWHFSGFTTELMRGYRHSMLFLPWYPWIDNVFWTLGVEIVFYTAVGVLIWRGKERAIGMLAVVLAWVCLGYWAAFSLGQSGAVPVLAVLYKGLPYLVDRLLELLLVKHGAFFAAGIFVWAVLIDRQKRPSWATLAAIAAACLVQIFWTTVDNNDGRDNPWWPAVAIWVGSLAVILLGIRHNLAWRSSQSLVSVLRVLGLMTYPLYLLHQNIGSVAVGVLRRAGIDPVTSLLAASAAVLLLSWLVVTYAEPVVKRWVGGVMDLVRLRLTGARAAAAPRSKG
ncbi:Peptidoglycan/LPS O-acetylase OafA/YrhL, contains acyltransferase and SGNH-hydrolase domains [Mitsuaria sp. PDC51]|uniref:acyltransferase family protein n=1 Tax=Mitsuaria sp. PDC51 TaxID=1881035 RepID=UPI0008EF528E|nr:acyltransferase [Mitsuaria sp. PDC51]SFR72423.1 Peptidoglycan/LPS O-acetylase OafA/YrhL, contains acyltransferase and SGNH-hydrolase domains [Mitsuaria sp. PDC51]